MSEKPAFRLGDYTAEHNHIETRKGLSADLRELLFAIPPDEWPAHVNYAGAAAFWQGVHRSLLSESGAFAAGLDQLSGMSPGEMQGGLLMNDLRHLGRHLLGHAHTHHHVEDDHYFPRFKLRYPQLGRPIDLLDGDHRVLEETLDAVGRHIEGFSAGKSGRDEIGAALNDAHKLDRILQRHLADEEDIVIPALLKKG
jgi:hemerythrin-like domain-containing protein